MEPMKVYAGYSKNQDMRMSSSSGAVFSSLAGYVLKQQGIVYGVKMSEDCYSAEFTRVSDSLELAKLRGSKYLQAKVGNTYKQVKEDLLADKLVLFSGTGCQVNGLKAFLGKEYSNLLCVDVICHGAPSPALWRKYAEHQEQKLGGKLRGINFRCKDDSWTDFGMKEVLDGIPQGNQKKIYVSKDKDAGRKIFEKIATDFQLKEVSYEDGVRSNPAEYKSCARPIQRNTFFDDMQSMKFEELEKKYAAPIKVPLKTKVKNIIKSMLRVIGGGQRV